MPPKKTEEEKAQKKEVTKKASVKKSAPKKTAEKIEKKAPAKKVEKKESLEMLSKGKQRKVQVDDKFPKQRYFLGVGKRKSAVANVRLHEKGKGQKTVNNKEFDSYFYGVLIENALQPLRITGKEAEFDLSIKVVGGGTSSQAEAVRHGIARALVEYDPELRPVLKPSGLLTRDSRVKERKKPGLRGARRSPQWSKR